MENIRTASELKIAIQQLEVKQHEDLESIKETIHNTYESLKPVNILKKTLSELNSTPYLIDNLLTTTLALVSGYLTKKAAVGSSDNIFRKVLGSILQFGVTNIVAQHSEDIISIGKSIFQKFFKKEKSDSDDET
ncbi:MAG: hypothetical protein WCP69_12390 [Bacteroidota bacterium]